ncbi:hypothetical protein OROMI_029898 [Orobanche minor]
MGAVGTPICVLQGEFIEIGYAKKGENVAVKIISNNSEEQQKIFGGHFGTRVELFSKISRRSLDALEEHYADDLSTEEKLLLFKLKKLFKIP